MLGRRTGLGHPISGTLSQNNFQVFIEPPRNALTPTSRCVAPDAQPGAIHGVTGVGYEAEG